MNKKLFVLAALSSLMLTGCPKNDPKPEPTPGPEPTPVVEVELAGIALSGTVKTEFEVGDEFTSEGLVVTASYSDGTKKAVEGFVVTAPDMSSAGQKEVKVSYTEKSVTKEATYQIIVSDPEVIPAEEIRLSKTDIFLSNGATEAIVATVLPAEADKSLTFESSNEAIATVNASGVVTATGSSVDPAVITVRSASNPKVFATVNVYVAAKSKINLINALYGLGKTIEGDIQLLTGAKGADEEPVAEAQDFKLHLTPRYRYTEGIAGIALFEEIVEGQADSGYFLVENDEDSFAAEWGKYYRDAADYNKNAYLTAANVAIIDADSSNYIYSSAKKTITVTDPSMLSVFTETLQIDYVTAEEIGSMVISTVYDEHLAVSFCASADGSEPKVTATLTAKESSVYQALEDFLDEQESLPRAPVSSMEIGNKGFGEGIYAEYYDYTWLGSAQVGGVVTYYTPYTQTECMFKNDWDEGGQWGIGEAVSQFMAQLSDDGYTVSYNFMEGNVSPEQFAEGKETKVLPAGYEDYYYDWDLYSSPYIYNVRQFENDGLFKLFTERFGVLAGQGTYYQGYGIKEGDTYTVEASDGTIKERTVTQEILQDVAQIFHLSRNISRFTGGVLEILPVQVDQIFILPEYTEGEAETIENLESFRVYINAIWNEYEYETDEDDDVIYDDDGNKIVKEVTENIFEGYFMDWIDYKEFGVMDPYYRASGIEDAAILLEITETSEYIISDDIEMYAEEAIVLAVADNILDDEVAVYLSAEDGQSVVDLTYFEDYDLYALAALALGETKLTLVYGEESREYTVSVVEKLNLVGTFNFTTGKDETLENHVLVITEVTVDEDGNEHYIGTLDGAAVDLYRDHNYLFGYLNEDETRYFQIHFNSLTDMEAVIIDLAE